MLAADQTLGDERLKGLWRSANDRLRGFERCAAGEHREKSERRLLAVREQTMTPVDGRAQRVLS